MKHEEINVVRIKCRCGETFTMPSDNATFENLRLAVRRARAMGFEPYEIKKSNMPISEYESLPATLASANVFQHLGGER